MANQHFDVTRMGRVRQIHFIGIGGVGMCGIAEVLFNDGYKVTGSDIAVSSMTERLSGLGIPIYVGHRAENVFNADVVVQSSAVKSDNPELIAAKEKNIPIIPRALMLAELMRQRFGIAIAGTHGKTTTTSLVTHLLAEAGLDPSYIIGGKLNSTGNTACLGKSNYLIAEADESDASFLYLKPTMTVVTNIDADHMSTYEESIDRLHETFVSFLHHLPFFGVAALCIDDSGIKKIISQVKRPIVTYGFDSNADVRAIDWQQQGLASHYTVLRKNATPLKVTFSLPGKHNVQNSLAAIAIATELNIPDEVILQGLAQFQGVGRRFHLYGEVPFLERKALLIDDYGHHPKEVESTIEAIRNVWPDKRLVLAFQPHRYSRTKALFKEFVSALSLVDYLVLLAVYPAGEAQMLGASHHELAEEIKKITPKLGVTVAELSELPAVLNEIVKEGDIVLTQGAGNIGKASALLAEKQTQVA